VGLKDGSRGTAKVVRSGGWQVAEVTRARHACGVGQGKGEGLTGGPRIFKFPYKFQIQSNLILSKS
jgi:hypothetical protein